MTYKSCIMFLVSSAMALLFPAGALTQTTQPTKLRVAVYPFDDRVVSKKDMDIGLKVSNLLISELTKAGTFTVLDRQHVDDLLKEKSLKYDPNFDSATAAKTGLMGTVDLIVFGQIGAFNANVEEKKRNIIAYIEVTKTGVVKLQSTAKFISVEKGEIVADPTAHTEQSRVIATDKIYRFKDQSTENGSKVDEEKALSDLVDQSAEQVAKELSGDVSKSAATLPPPTVLPQPAPGQLAKSTLPEPSRTTTGGTKCLGVEDGLAIIAEGSAEGIKPGDRFKIRRTSPSAVLGPDGKPIVRHRDVCTLTVSSVEEHTAEGKCTPLPTEPRTDAIPKRDDEAVPLSEKSPQVASSENHKAD
jgi:hypothetical protein